MSTTIVNGVEVDTTELDKQIAAREQGSQEIGEFLDWLNQQGVQLCRWRTDLTDIRPCYGFNRHGEVITPFDLHEPNCEEGRVANKQYRRHASSQDKEGTLYEVGDTCPRCEGKGSLEFPASERFVVESKTIQQWLSDYFEIDLAKADKEQRDLLAALQREA